MMIPPIDASSKYIEVGEPGSAASIRAKDATERQIITIGIIQTTNDTKADFRTANIRIVQDSAITAAEYGRIEWIKRVPIVVQ
jgi:hypothetical protein